MGPTVFFWSEYLYRLCARYGLIVKSAQRGGPAGARGGAAKEVKAFRPRAGTVHVVMEYSIAPSAVPAAAGK